METVTSTEFAQNVGQYQATAQRTPVRITKNGKPHAVLISEHLYNVLMHGRANIRVEDLDDEMLKAISEAKVPDRFKHLDTTLDPK